MRRPLRCTLASLTATVLLACAQPATVPPEAAVGPQPLLPPPAKSLLPTVNIAPAVGWPPGATPAAAPGFAVAAFASGLEHPRWVYTLPNGDVLVAETNAPPKPDDGKGIKGTVMRFLMRQAGSAGVPSALGRPVGVAVDRSGALLVADDVGNAVWRVTPVSRLAAR